MKKIAAALLALCMLPLLSCCSAAPRIYNDGSAALPVPGEEARRADAARAELELLLSRIAAVYDGEKTAFSLSAKEAAAELLDWHSAVRPDAEDIEASAKESFMGFTPQEAALFPVRLDSVWRAAYLLSSPGESSPPELYGYEPQSWPWSSESARALFSALYGGLGRELPDPQPADK